MRIVHAGITRLFSVLPELQPPAPADTSVIVLVHYLASGAVLYWANGWTTDRSQATEYPTFRAASEARRAALRQHPGMRISMRGNWMVRS